VSLPNGKSKTLIDFEVLKDFGFTKNEIHAFITILTLGLCEVREICSKTNIPTSKIYNILDKLEKYGLIEIQKTRPKKCKAVNINLLIERLKDSKLKEYEEFKNKLPIFKEFLEKRVVKFEDTSTFWHVAIDEDQIIKKHISRFKYVDFVGEICVDYDVMDLIVRKYKMGNTITINFKNKKIITKLLIAYQTDKQKEDIIKWLDFRPRKADSKNKIRLIHKFIQKPFGLIDIDKVIMLIRHPVNENKFISSIYMINKKLHGELVESFKDLWEKAEDIGRD